MNFKFPNENSKKFYTLLCANLKEELALVVSIAKGDAHDRQDIGDKYVKGASALLGLAGSAFPFAAYSAVIVSVCGDIRNAKNKLQKHDFVTSLQRYQFGKQSEVMLNILAREATYFFSPLLNNMIQHSEGYDQNSSKAFELLAKVGAMRVIFYAMTQGIPLEDTQEIVLGLIEGYQGFRGDSLSHSFGGSKWYNAIIGNTKGKFYYCLNNSFLSVLYFIN